MPILNSYVVIVIFGSYIDFQVCRSWVISLYCRIQFSCRKVATSRPIITKSLRVEVRSQFLHKIIQKVLQYNIPNKLIINANQTPPKFVATDSITMAVHGAKHVSRRMANDKRVITVKLCECFDGVILPFKFICTGKTKIPLPNANFPQGFYLAFNAKHWSNETEAIRVINVLDPSKR